MSAQTNSERISSDSVLATASAIPYQEGLELKLETLGYKLAVANQDACTHPEMRSGLIVHDIASYNAKDRGRARSEFNMNLGFGVVNVVEGSGSYKAELKRGDEIIDVNGISMRDFATDAIYDKASYNRVARFTDFLSAQMLSGSVQIKILRNNAQYELILTGTLGCGGQFVVMPSNKLNAWSDGKYVAVTTKMMEYAPKEEELAFVVAHEMAHNILGHAKQLRGKSMLLASLGWGSQPFRQSEAEADRFAVKILNSANEDPTAALRILNRIRHQVPLDLGLTHPTIGKRIAVVEDAMKRISLGAK